MAFGPNPVVSCTSPRGFLLAEDLGRPLEQGAQSEGCSKRSTSYDPEQRPLSTFGFGERTLNSADELVNLLPRNGFRV